MHYIFMLYEEDGVISIFNIEEEKLIKKFECSKLDVFEGKEIRFNRIEYIEELSSLVLSYQNKDTFLSGFLELKIDLEMEDLAVKLVR